MRARTGWRTAPLRPARGRRSSAGWHPQSRALPARTTMRWPSKYSSLSSRFQLAGLASYIYVGVRSPAIAPGFDQRRERRRQLPLHGIIEEEAREGWASKLEHAHECSIREL